MAERRPAETTVDRASVPTDANALSGRTTLRPAAGGRSMPVDMPYPDDQTMVAPLPVPRRPRRPVAEKEPSERLSRKERVAIRRASTVRARATVRHLDVLTVLRVSAIFYFLLLIIVVVASVLLVYAASAFGTLPSIEKSVRTLFDLKTFTIHPTVVAAYTAGGAAILAVAGIIANVLGALIYNLIADVVGGIRVELDSFPD